MGQPKLLLPWQGKTLLEHTLEVWRGSGVEQIILVIRLADAPLAEIGNRCGVQVVQPPQAPPDMKASLQYGIAAIERLFQPQAHDGWFIAPADLPRLSPAIIERLLAAFQPSLATAYVPTVGGKRGHPLLLPWSWAPRLAQLASSEGLNALLKRHAVQTIDCTDLPFAADMFQDIDTPEDFERLLNVPIQQA